MLNAVAASWQLWALLAACCAAPTAIFAKLGVDEIDPDLATFLRTVVVVVALGILVFAAGKMQGLSRVSSRGAVFLILSGLATGASWLCYFRAMKVGDVSQVAPVDKLSLALVAVFAAFFLGEHLSVTAWVGVGLMVAGSMLVAFT